MIKIRTAHTKVDGVVNGRKILRKLERHERTSHKSEGRITKDSAPKFVRSLLKRHHLSVLEHVSISVKIFCDRAIEQEITRHRIAAYTIESTRYVNYRSHGITVIEPFFFVGDKEKYAIWLRVMRVCEEGYLELIALGAKPEEARTVLPLSLKAEMDVTYNLREWRHFFKVRCAKDAHPQMREIVIPLLRKFQELVPVVFEDITVDGLPEDDE